MNNNLPVTGVNAASLQPAQITAAATNLINVPSTVSFVELRRDSVNYPRIYAIESKISYQAVTMIVAQAFTIRGQKPDVDTLRGTSTMLLDMILSDEDRIGMNELTIPEISRAVRHSALYNDCPVSVASMYLAIRSYILTAGDKARRDAKQADEAEKAARFKADHPQYAAEHAARMRDIMKMFEGFGN